MIIYLALGTAPVAVDRIQAVKKIPTCLLSFADLGKFYSLKEITTKMQELVNEQNLPSAECK